MSTHKKISIKSILHDLSLIIPNQYWDDYRMLEWATSAARQIRIMSNFVQKYSLTTVKSHKFTLPSDLVAIQQILVYKGEIPPGSNAETVLKQLGVPQSFTDLIEANIKASSWRPMLPSSSPFLKSILCPANIFADATAQSKCEIVYDIDERLQGTTTLKDGIILIAYLAYDTDEDGYPMIPDLEDFREAVQYYCLHKFFTLRAMFNEADAFRKSEYYRSLWFLYKSKATATANEPDLGTLESIRRMTSSIKTPSHFDSVFVNTSQKK